VEHQAVHLEANNKNHSVLKALASRSTSHLQDPPHFVTDLAEIRFEPQRNCQSRYRSA
jgi:hypothetical protein